MTVNIDDDLWAINGCPSGMDFDFLLNLSLRMMMEGAVGLRGDQAREGPSKGEKESGFHGWLRWVME